MSESIITHLLTLHPSAYESATTHPFLLRAGRGTLPKHILQQWLGQDRLYALAYEQFIGTLNSRLQTQTPAVDGVNDLLDEALQGIKREIGFFEDVAGRYGLDIGTADAGEGVKAYKKLFEHCSSNFLDGLTLLWATEKVYLEAWRFAQRKGEGKTGEGDNDGGALRRELIPNWTSVEFEAFVGRCEGVLERVWAMGGSEGRLERVQGIWERVLEVEGIFWPDVEM